MSPADVLLKAADRVQFVGWTQEAYAQDVDGRPVGARNPAAVRWCARGAMKAEVASRYQFEKAVGTVEDFLNREEPDHWEIWTLMDWNDQSCRTAGEVADTMRRVAKELQNSA